MMTMMCETKDLMEIVSCRSIVFERTDILLFIYNIELEMDRQSIINNVVIDH